MELDDDLARPVEDRHLPVVGTCLDLAGKPHKQSGQARQDAAAEHDRGHGLISRVLKWAGWVSRRADDKVDDRADETEIEPKWPVGVRLGVRDLCLLIVAPLSRRCRAIGAE